MLLLLGGIVAAGLGIRRLVTNGEAPGREATSRRPTDSEALAPVVSVRARAIWRGLTRALGAAVSAVAGAIVEIIREAWPAVKAATVTTLVSLVERRLNAGGIHVGLHPD